MSIEREGDFNYDGVVNFADLLLLAQNYGQSLPIVQEEVAASIPHNVDPSFASVPEPAVTGPMVIVILVIARRRR